MVDLKTVMQINIFFVCLGVFCKPRILLCLFPHKHTKYEIWVQISFFKMAYSFMLALIPSLARNLHISNDDMECKNMFLPVVFDSRRWNC